MDLILRTANGDFDLFGNESIVQTLGIFSFNDITAFNGEYTNVFNLPLTNNNRKLIEYADFIPSVNTSPYKKIPITLIVGGLDFKTGFIVIDSISDVIKTRVFSGNATFYELLKSIYLNDLDWSQYDHTWNYANAVASSANNGGYIYPVIDYGGQTLTGDIVDIRKILPATFVKTILVKIFEYTDYQYIDDFDRTDLNKSVLAYTNKNPIYPAPYLLLNSLDASNTVDQGYNELLTIKYDTLYINDVINSITDQDVSLLMLGGYILTYTHKRMPFYQGAFGTGAYWDAIYNQYTSNANGVYNYNVVADFTSINTHYSIENVITSDFDSGFPGAPYFFNGRVSVRLIVNRGGNISIIETNEVTTGVNWSGSTFLSQGDIMYLEYKYIGDLQHKIATSRVGSNPRYNYYAIRFFPIIDHTTNLFTLNLQDGLAFGNPITYSALLPKIKCNDFIKDLCIRFGLILNVNEDTKTVTISQIDKLTENIPNAVNWSDKLDESDLPNVQFMYDNYAQINLFTHSEDKTVVNKQIGGDYNLLINNANLESSKTFYTSPFSECDNTKFNNTITSVIPTYNTTSILFDKDVKPKILFSEAVTGLFKFTDGTSTSGYINTKRVYFIDLNVPNLCMGFESSLIPKNSQTLVSTLQNIRIVKANFNLNINDIKSIDWLTPVYIEQFQSYFFVTSINQFNYTNPDLTEVELIKLNP